MMHFVSMWVRNFVCVIVLAWCLLLAVVAPEGGAALFVLLVISHFGFAGYLVHLVDHERYRRQKREEEERRREELKHPEIGWGSQRKN